MIKKILKNLLLVTFLTITTVSLAQTPEDFSFDTDNEGFLFSAGLTDVVEGGLLKVTADGSKTNAQLRKNAVDVGASGELSRVVVIVKNGTNATKLQLRKSGTLIVDDIVISANDSSQQFYVIDVPSGNADWVGSLQLRLQFIVTDGSPITGTLEVDRIQVNTPAVLSTEKNLLEGTAAYPNPANDILNVKCPLNSKVSLFNILGVKVKSTISNSELSELSVSDLPRGVYVLKINSDNKTKISKVILK